MEIEAEIGRHEITILFDVLAEGRIKKSIFGLLMRACALPHEKTSCSIPVPKESHEDE
jgi:hypothetical protein